MSSCAISLTVLYSAFCFIFAQLKKEENKKSNTLFSMNSLTFNPFTCTMETVFADLFS